jgi:hypothetical protein
MWVALDDSPPDGLLNSHWKPNPHVDLTIGRIDLTEFSFRGFGRVIEEIDASSFSSSDALQIHPGFVFGVWRTEFVRQVWPQHSMDWLDTFILLCARTNGRVELAEALGPWILGHSNKAPHKVNGRFHNPLRWGLQVLRLYGFRRSPRDYVSLLRAFAGKAHFGLIELKESFKK